MYLDVKVRLSNKFWARHLVDTVAMWLRCNSTPPFRVDSWWRRRNYHIIKHVQRPLQLLHLQLSVHSVQMGLVRTESQSPEPSARSNLGEIPPSLSLQR